MNAASLTKLNVYFLSEKNNLFTYKESNWKAIAVIDIDEIRDIHIRSYGLAKADEAYTFYHDETNNIKKLRLNSQGFNVTEPDFFALGGIAHNGSPRALDIKSLRDAMGIQKSADEIKLKHVGKGDFLDLIKSDKLTTFLQWIADNDLIIHYHALDPLYWSLVDIMDSILYGLGEQGLIQSQAILKADLATLLRANLTTTTNLLFCHNYPNLIPKNRKIFLEGLLEILEHSNDVLPEFNTMMLKGMLQAGRNLPSLEFIEGFTPHVLIESFGVFYLTRIAVFKYSSHILDMEDSIRDEIEAMKPSSNGMPLINYRFSDSKSEVGIQISDIIVGLIGKMYSYFVWTQRSEVMKDRASLSGTSLKNTELLRDLIDASHDENIAFLNHVCSISDIDKMNLFLRNRGSVYEG